jgi:hypothetical protein
MVNLTNEHLEKLPKREILRIIYAYNMHVKIKGYRNKSKPELIHEIMKRVSVDAEGKLTLKDIMVDDENKNVPKSINWVRKPLKGRVKKVKEPEPEPEPKAKATKAKKPKATDNKKPPVSLKTLLNELKTLGDEYAYYQTIDPNDDDYKNAEKDMKQIIKEYKGLKKELKKYYNKDVPDYIASFFE